MKRIIEKWTRHPLARNRQARERVAQTFALAAVFLGMAAMGVGMIRME